MKRVIMYTDGACSGNPGPGGYGVVLIYGGRTKELSAGYRDTTNNRMELRAVIAGLEALKEECRVVLYTDSRYIADSINNGWVDRWKANGWKRNKREHALNPDLWSCILRLCRRHRVTFHWTKGHAGNSWNERCDELAVIAAQGDDLLEDIREDPVP